MTYKQLKSRFPHIAPHKLHDILREALRKKQADTSLGLTSLLQRGALAWRLVFLALLRRPALLLTVCACFPFCAYTGDKGEAADVLHYIFYGACRADTLPCKSAPVSGGQVAEAPL